MSLRALVVLSCVTFLFAQTARGDDSDTGSGPATTNLGQDQANSIVGEAQSSLGGSPTTRLNKMLDEGQYDQVIQAAGAMSNPNEGKFWTSDALFEKADAAYKSQDYAAAQDSYDKAFALTGQDYFPGTPTSKMMYSHIADRLISLADCRTRLGNAVGAEQSYRDALTALDKVKTSGGLDPGDEHGLRVKAAQGLLNAVNSEQN